MHPQDAIDRLEPMTEDLIAKKPSIMSTRQLFPKIVADKHGDAVLRFGAALGQGFVVEMQLSASRPAPAAGACKQSQG